MKEQKRVGGKLKDRETETMLDVLLILYESTRVVRINNLTEVIQVRQHLNPTNRHCT